MKIKLLIALTFLLSLNGNAQQKDSISSFKNELSYKHFIIPAALISSGLVLKNAPMNKNLQGDSRKFSELISIQKLMIICNLLQYSKSMVVAIWALNQRMIFFIKTLI